MPAGWRDEGKPDWREKLEKASISNNGLLPDKQHNKADQIVNNIEKSGAVHGLPNGPPVLPTK